MKASIWILSIALIVLVGCSTTYNAVSNDYDRSVDFSQYKTFAWLPDKADTANTPYNNEIIRNNIRNYFGQCMSDRGYMFDGESPDILMQLVITNAKKERVITSYPSSYYYRPYYFGSFYYTPYPYGYYYRHYPSYGYGYSGFPGYSTTQKQEYVNGSITLNFIDRKNNKLVWTGTAEGDIYDASHISHDLHPAVHSILNEYPVKPLVNRSHKMR
ncbi:MAG TPA: DUF4136 domain-containing protein [Chitinophagaceae bacterium]|nr:DUF4136 domain-containing protein [Chitinophagaceae bacterium]